ncbi:hypothetical protein CRE_05153 [Caenorhabditis remanei]|uniref:Uncharacterized protein n=1 Tax=Caenorhabditis remanei TaxID=31234 RepID=E3N6C6_CAERE|nr:hypothetical protein CRE_05153 [Caenorhabditis remanei]
MDVSLFKESLNTCDVADAAIKTIRKWRKMYRDGEMDQELLDEKRNGLIRDLRQQTLVLNANEIPGLVKFIYDQNGVNI